MTLTMEESSSTVAAVGMHRRASCTLADGQINRRASNSLTDGPCNRRASISMTDGPEGRRKGKGRRASLVMADGDANMQLLKSGIEDFHRQRGNHRVTLADLSDSDRMEIEDCFQAMVDRSSKTMTLKNLIAAAELVLGHGKYSEKLLEKGMRVMNDNKPGGVAWIEFRAYLSNNWAAGFSAENVLNDAGGGKVLFADNAGTTRLVDLIKAYRRRTMMQRMLMDAEGQLKKDEEKRKVEGIAEEDSFNVISVRDQVKSFTMKAGLVNIHSESSEESFRSMMEQMAGPPELDIPGSPTVNGGKGWGQRASQLLMLPEHDNPGGVLEGSISASSLLYKRKSNIMPTGIENCALFLSHQPLPPPLEDQLSRNPRRRASQHMPPSATESGHNDLSSSGLRHQRSNAGTEASTPSSPHAPPGEGLMGGPSGQISNNRVSALMARMFGSDSGKAAMKKGSQNGARNLSNSTSFASQNGARNLSSSSISIASHNGGSNLSEGGTKPKRQGPSNIAPSKGRGGSSSKDTPTKKGFLPSIFHK